MNGPLVVVGDTLLDRDLVGRVSRVAPDAPVPVVEDIAETARPGGAGLAALLAARDGEDVVLVTALAGDAGGAELRALLGEAGVTVLAARCAGPTTQKVRVRTGQQSIVRLDYGGGAAPIATCPPALLSAVARAGTVLVADYGRGVAALPALRGALSSCRAPIVWDPHPRGPAPVPGVAVATPNLAEARTFAGVADPARCGAALLTRWRCSAVAVTVGADGAVLVRDQEGPVYVPSVPARGDSCGAGDRFSAAVAGALRSGLPLDEAVVNAVHAAAEYVAADGPAGLVLESSRTPLEVS